MKIGLGAVQFGVNYGVSNIYGKTTKNEASKILQFAYENGINVIDTAISYGNSEDILGEVITNDDWKMQPREYQKNLGWQVLNEGEVKGKIIIANLNT